MMKTAPQSSIASAASQPKIEKKLMDEKISKVREVVKNVSTNDIVLALHNFELDVEKTIHAFCEGLLFLKLGEPIFYLISYVCSKFIFNFQVWLLIVYTHLFFIFYF